MKSFAKVMMLGLVSGMVFATAALADDFHGFDPGSFNGATALGMK